MDKTTEINNAVMLELSVHGIEYTLETYLAHLIKLRNRWLEDGVESPAKIHYIGTINMEILTLEMIIDNRIKS